MGHKYNFSNLFNSFDNMLNKFDQTFTAFDQVFSEMSHNTPNISKTEQDKHVYEIEVAGVKREEIKIKLVDIGLIISVESTRKKFERVIYLTEQHDKNNINVSLKDGLLTITIGKVKRTSTPEREIKID